MTAIDSHLFLRALVDEFARCGMRDACTSPGSRNTPIVLTLTGDSRLRTWSHIDERAAGFFALGLARSSGLPVAVTCTSGTAAANLLPAVIEAHESALPLLVLTADRPPELREVGAGQTIDQVKLFGGAVKWFFELGVPEATPDQLRWGRSLACRAYWTALEGRSGPVHLNIPLREPLVLDEPLGDAEPGGGGRPDGRPWVTQAPMRRLSSPPVGLRPMPRTVFVAGDLGGDPELGRRLAETSEQLRIPLLADPLSNARRGPTAVAHYDLFLRDPDSARSLSPELVCRVGALPTSKPLRAWLSQLAGAEHLTLAPDDRWSDPLARTTMRATGDVHALLDELQAEASGVETDSNWCERWLEADRISAAAVTKVISESGLSEPAVAATLGELLTPDATLFIAASMPIRDVEAFFPVREHPPRMLANRGANGIDGTVSSAFGVAAAAPGEVVLLLGDVALAHDVGALLTNRRTDLKLTIVLLNNGGGGIFDFLPVRDRADREAFEQHIATPTGLAFDQIAELYGLEHTRPAGRAAFRVAVERALGGSASTLIEVRTARQPNRDLHAAIEQAVLQALR